MFRLNDKTLINKMMTAMVLWMVSKKESSGYDIVKLLKEDGIKHMGLASRVYPLLSRMEGMGLVKRKDASTGKRKSYSYTITKKGASMLKFVSQHMGTGLRGEFLRAMLNGKN